MGCIPVLLDIGQMRLWKNYWDPWKSSIFIDMHKNTSNEIFDMLRKIPKTEISKIRKYNQNMFKKLVYTNETPNVFDVLRRLIFSNDRNFKQS